MLKVALIGCGLISDQHVTQVQRIPNATLVAVCDLEVLMAQQLADRFRIPAFYTDIGRMLQKEQPDVVHVTTPAQTHYPIARRCLESGCHVYVEKPFTVTAEEAESLIKIASDQKLLLTVGHNLQFSPEAQYMRACINSGCLGGFPLHIDCLQYFPHGEANYGSALLGDPTHWVRSLPGSLLQNLISHGLAKVVEYIPTDRPQVLAHVHPSQFLKNMGQGDIVDELRAIITDGDQVTAHFTFSTQIAGAPNQIVLHGPKGSILCDSTHRLVTQMHPSRFKSYLRFFLEPWISAKNTRQNVWRNIRQFLKYKFHMDQGMKVLMESFYGSIEHGQKLPISYREILATARIMDEICNHIHSQVTSIPDTTPKLQPISL